MILRAQNTELFVRGKPLTYLSSPSVPGAATFTVESPATFATDNYIQVGNVGAERTEVVQVHTSISPSGSTITLTSAGALYAHDEGTPLYKVDFNRVEFSRATTVTGSKSVLATSDLTMDDMDTIYDDTANSTGFGFWRFNNETTATFSDYSDAIPYAGYDIDTANEIFERALSNAGTEVNPLLTLTELFNFLNDFITLANSRNKRWSGAKVLEYEMATLATGDWEMALPSDISERFDPSAIISLRISGFQEVYYRRQRDFNKVMIDTVYTKANGVILDSDTEIDLDNAASFSDSGTIQINGDSISYTGKSSNQLTGVTGIATGGHADDSYVFQRPVTGVPAFYTFSSDGNIRTWPIASSEVNNRVLYISYYRRLPKVDSLGDKILVNDISSVVDYVSYRIKKHEGGGTISPDDIDFMAFIKNFKNTINRDTPGQPGTIKRG